MHFCAQKVMSSDYRCNMNNHQNSSPSNQVNKVDQTENCKQKMSYANVTQSDSFPTKDQAIIIDAIDGIPIREYVCSVGSLINPINIKFVSRISKNRICMYLSSSSIVKTLIENNSTIKINNNTLLIRPLLTKYKRIVLSNVCPIIPHEILEKKLNELNIRLGSKITFLRAGYSNTGYSHIMSFRRQVFIHPEDINILPETFNIEFDETNYWIYLSTDAISCFICKSQGHLAKHCTENNVSSNNADISTNLPDTDVNGLVPSSESPTTTIPHEVTTSEKVCEATDHPVEPVRAEKRPLSISDSNTSSNILLNDPDKFPCLPAVAPKVLKTPQQSKKLKKSKSHSDNKEDLDKFLLPLKEILSSPNNPYVLDYLQLKCLLDRTKGVSKIAPIVSEFTTDFPAVISLLTNTYPLLTERFLKTRFTKIKRKLENEHDQDVSFTSNSSDEEIIVSQNQN